MRKIIPTAVMVVSLVAVTTVGAAAQDEPAAVAITPAGLNADKIDGKHAVGHGASVKKRAGKLVATNKRGQLPSNIVKPAWRLILGKPAAFRDGRITWGEVQNKPTDFEDGKIGWGELAGTPPKITLTTHTRPFSFTGPGLQFIDIPCPAGKVTGGGFFDVDANLTSGLLDSYPVTPTTWRLTINVASGTDTGTGFATCMTAEPATLVARLTPAARNPKGDR